MGSNLRSRTNDAVVLGAGLAGLAAAHALTRAGRSAYVVESGGKAGGMCRTIEHQGHRFDLGGHRFLTDDPGIEAFIRSLLGPDCLTVPRKSRIYLKGRYFDYPLTPANALFGMGLKDTVRILAGYAAENLSGLFRRRDAVSLEDWVIGRFGRAMFDLYFREYSEKVWGIGCDRISMDWVSRRIEGLSLWKAIRNAFWKRSGRDIKTLADAFLYPSTGIGLIAERLLDGIRDTNTIALNTAVCRLDHDGFEITKALVRSNLDMYDLEGAAYVSSIPLTALVRALCPAPPEAVRQAAERLAFRDLVVAAVMLDRDRVTDLSWLYLPERHIPFGRIHEPKNWSTAMAPEGRAHIVAEYFCFRGDDVWNARDDEITARTVRHLCSMGFISGREVTGSLVVRVPKAYPLFSVGYGEHHAVIMNYLKRFRNLHVAGRGGTFRYLNMDHAIASGWEAADKVLRNGSRTREHQEPCRGSARKNTDTFVGTTP